MTEQSNQTADVLNEPTGADAGQVAQQPVPTEADAVAPQAPVSETPASETIAVGPDGPAEQDASVEQTSPAKAEPVAAAPRPRSKKKAAQQEPEPEVPAEPKSEQMDWFILKVQSNREESIREGLMRRVAIAGLDRFFGDVIVPTEKVTEFKGGKKRVIKRKLYPGYLVVQMEINEDTWFLVRETPGIGDFTGASGHPVPMLPHEVSRIIAKQEEKSEKSPKVKIGVTAGQRVRINEGTFENFEGDVETIDETNGRVTVMINIFGRSTPVELEYWQIEAL